MGWRRCLTPFLLGAAVQAADMGGERLTCQVTPRVIEAGTFYNGASVRVEGVAALRSQVVVTVSGSDRVERFNRKARFGPIWVNAGKVRISGAPSLFLRFSAAPVAALLDRASIAARGLDEASATARMRIEPVSADEAALRAGYLALKRSDGVYAFTDGGVRRNESGYTLEFRWPKKAPPAQYQVHVYELRDGAVLEETSVPLAVVATGFPAWLAGIAEDQAPLYGLTAVLIAVLAGFGIDFLTTHLFGGKRTVSH